VRNLKAYAISRGVEVFEHTPVSALSTGSPVVLETGGGQVRADRVLVATNAWASSIPELRRRMYVVDSQVVATEPIPDRLDALGWKGGESICDSQTQVLYYQRTEDGRVVFGRGTGGTIFGGRVGGTFNRNQRWLAGTLRELHRVYPSLRDVKIDYDWTGPIDCVPSHVPQLGHLDGQPNVYYAIGWNGTALAQIPACSHIVASMLLEADDVWGRSRLIDQPHPQSLPPEPVRYLGANAVRIAVNRKNSAEIHDQRPDLLTRALVALMPGSSEH
jgi:glycine/D-amino acid oxidase-like deaminating enzyme